MQKLKTVNFDFYRLSLKDEEPKKLAELFLRKTKLKSLPKETGPVILYEGKYKPKGPIIFGTMSHTQMFDLPPAQNRNTGDISNLDLNEDQGLGFATSFIFDTKTNVIAFESNQNGVKLGSFLEFLEFNYKLPKIDSELVIDPADFNKLTKLTQVTKLHFKVARLDNAGIFASDVQTVKDSIKLAKETDANSIETIISVGRSRSDSLIKGGIYDIIKAFLPFKDREEILKLEVTGREDEEPKVIDFIKNRIRMTINFPRQRNSSGFNLIEKYHAMENEYSRYNKLLYTAYKI